jgi:hypothetical protein
MKQEEKRITKTTKEKNSVYEKIHYKQKRIPRTKWAKGGGG